jgi:hypothetical protein
VVDSDRRYNEWVDIICELVTSAIGALPHELLLRCLADSFQACATWHHIDLPNGTIRLETSDPPPGWPPPGEEDYFLRVGMPSHPVFRWFQETGDTTAMSLGRVPLDFAPQLLSQGLPAVAMAHRLGISVRTVNKHLEHVYRKLETTDRLLAVQLARDLGVIVAGRSPDELRARTAG